MLMVYFVNSWTTWFVCVFNFFLMNYKLILKSTNIFNFIFLIQRTSKACIIHFVNIDNTLFWTAFKYTFRKSGGNNFKIKPYKFVTWQDMAAVCFTVFFVNVTTRDFTWCDNSVSYLYNEFSFTELLTTRYRETWHSGPRNVYTAHVSRPMRGPNTIAVETQCVRA